MDDFTLESNRAILEDWDTLFVDGVGIGCVLESETENTLGIPGTFRTVQVAEGDIIGNSRLVTIENRVTQVVVSPSSGEDLGPFVVEERELTDPGFLLLTLKAV